MKQKIIFAFLILSQTCFSQSDTAWLRGFPITDYMVALDDTTIIVQLEMPEGLKLKHKQLGLIYGTYKDSSGDVMQKGYGKCYLIKDVYHYFAISHNKSGKALQKGDLLYTFLPPNPGIFYGRIPKLAGHFIRLKNVYGNNLFDRYNVFLKWTEQDEKQLIDSLVADIRMTGTYFMENQPAINESIKSGPYQGNLLLDFMAECEAETVEDFLDFVIAKPRTYAGNEWKVSEIFATWLKNGAPSR